MEKSNIGLIGLAVMGENLALNIEGHGYQVSLYNRPHRSGPEMVDVFLENRGNGKKFVATYTISDFVGSLERPRKIMMMIKAGEPVEEMIEQLIPYLEPGDVIIDGGNSDFRDTERRYGYLLSKGIWFVGAGVSGGETGALHGPSIMPGGAPEAWEIVRPFLQDIAAHLDDGTPCCSWMGSGGAGHFVKMVHNGIEYGDMQLIAEAYMILKSHAKMNNEIMADIFEQWNRGELNSYLIGITSHILRFKDSDGSFLIEHIRDSAGQKGTGKWSVEAALDVDEPLSLISEAVFARFISRWKEVREKASVLYPPEKKEGKEHDLPSESVRQALFAAKLVSYAQGFSLLKNASELYGWNIDLSSVATIWRKGCIIRAGFLKEIAHAYSGMEKPENLLFNDWFRDYVNNALPAWRKIVSRSAMSGIPVPCMSSALAYFDMLRQKRSGAALIQAQRDYFGAHTYERTDAPQGEFFHTDWTGTGGNTVSGSYTV